MVSLHPHGFVIKLMRHTQLFLPIPRIMAIWAQTQLHNEWNKDPELPYSITVTRLELEGLRFVKYSILL
jgi:hypothetical protein